MPLVQIACAGIGIIVFINKIYLVAAIALVALFAIAILIKVVSIIAYK